MNKDKASPRSPRSSVMLVAEIDRSSGRTRHRILNISECGAGILDPLDLVVGAEVMFSVGALEMVPATIAWVAEDRVGVRFHHPIDPSAARNRNVSATKTAVSEGWLGNMRDRYRRH